MHAFLGAALLFCAPQEPVSIGERVATLTSRIEVERLRATIDDLVGFHSRHVLSKSADDGRGTGAARDYLEAKFRECIELSDGRLTVARESFAVPSRRLGREVEVVNIVATLRGVSDPDRVYVVGGHYDSINSDPRDPEGRAPGANDDGSGTAVVLEACRVMCQAPLAATVMFVAYDGEEMGLLGSTAHAAALAEAETEVDGMITNDIVGNTLGMDGVRRPDYVRCFSYAPRGNDSRGRSLARSLSYAARTHLDSLRVMLIYRGDRYGRGGDHRPFHAEGFPSVRLTEPREDYSRQHQNVIERDGAPYGDLPEFMDFDYMTRVCALDVATLTELASAPRSPSGLRARGESRAYDTRISWQPVEGAAGYEAVWRLTTSADWEHSLELADVSSGGRGRLEAVLSGVCLDDVVVGVRALGADGSRSRVSTPPEPDAFLQSPSRGR